jgi:TolA-binding protein
MTFTMTTKLIFATLFILIAPMSSVLAQSEFTTADSLQFEQARNDSGQLRQLTISRKGDRIAAKAQNELGSIAIQNKKEEKAESEYNQTYQQYVGIPEADEATLNLGKINIRNRNFSEAKKYFKEYLQNNRSFSKSQWAKYYLLRSMSETIDPEFPDSVQSYFAASRGNLSHKDVVVQNELIRYYEEKGDQTHVISEAAKLVQNYPASQYVHMNEVKIVDAYVALGNMQAALGYCNSLLSKYAVNTDDAASAQHMLGSVYANMKNYSRAREEYAKVATDHSTAARRIIAAEYSDALLDLEEGREENNSTLIATAFDKLKAFVQNHPNNHHVPAALMNIADLQSIEGKYEEAIVAYNGIINFNDSLIATGDDAYRSKDYQTHNKMVRNAHINKGMLLLTKLRKPNEALAEYEAILADQPTSADALFHKALCLIDLQDTPDARNILQQLVDGNTSVKEVSEKILESL